MITKEHFWISSCKTCWHNGLHCFSQLFKKKS